MVRDDRMRSLAFRLQFWTERHIHARTRRNLVQEENFSGSGKYALGSVTDAWPDHFAFYTSSSFSRRGPINVSWGQCSSGSDKKAGPLSHRQCLSKFAARRPRGAIISGVPKTRDMSPLRWVGRMMNL